MASEQIKLAIQEFAKSGNDSYNDKILINGKYYHIKIDKLEMVGEDFSNINKSNKISAGGYGTPCSSCNGSGQA